VQVAAVPEQVAQLALQREQLVPESKIWPGGQFAPQLVPP
jgi:hypothetical protein